MMDPKKPVPTGTPAGLAPPNKDHGYFENHGDYPFGYDARRFEMVNARWMAEAALLAYLDRDFAGARLARVGLSEVRHSRGKSAQCYAAHNGDFVLVAFSSSDIREHGGNEVFDALADWMVSLSFDTVPSSRRGGRVHRGFVEALDGIWEGLEVHLDGLREEGSRRAWFAGRSWAGRSPPSPPAVTSMRRSCTRSARRGWGQGVRGGPGPSRVPFR